MKILIENYTFDASAGTIEFDDYVSIIHERIFIVSNVTDGVLIYNFAAAGATGTVATNVLTLDFDTSAMSDTDNLLIVYDDPDATQDVSGTVTVAEPVTVDGTVTANAGTNLNTSLLALEAGGNLAAIAASLAILDDWDESDRAKTNPIVGQAGVQGGAGAVSANTQRIAIATDANGISGTVTANAGTNLNTSTLALEAGGNLAGAATSLAIIDDWDESDRAKVNPIVGQAGVQAGAGAVSATTQRTVLATDDPAVVSLAIIDDWDESDRAKVNVIVGQAGITAGAGAVAANTPRVTHASDDPAVTALQIMDDWDNTASDGASVSGDVAHDGVDAGEPVKVGGVAVSGSASPTSVAAADRTRWIFNQHGIPYVLGGHPNLITREYDFGTSAQTDVNLAAAVVAADERIYVTRYEVTCDKANTVNVSARAGFGTANVPTASSSGVSGMIGTHPGIAPGSGMVSGDGSGIIAVGGAGEEPRFTSSAATTGNTHVLISYFLVDETP